jgi:hypothetical protein
MIPQSHLYCESNHVTDTPLYLAVPPRPTSIHSYSTISRRYGDPHGYYRGRCGRSIEDEEQESAILMRWRVRTRRFDHAMWGFNSSREHCDERRLKLSLRRVGGTSRGYAGLVHATVWARRIIRGIVEENGGYLCFFELQQNASLFVLTSVRRSNPDTRYSRGQRPLRATVFEEVK